MAEEVIKKMIVGDGCTACTTGFAADAKPDGVAFLTHNVSMAEVEILTGYSSMTSEAES